MTPTAPWEVVTPADSSVQGSSIPWSPLPDAVSEWPPRSFVGSTSLAVLADGTLYLGGGLVVPAGELVSAVTFMSSNVVMTLPQHFWFCLINADTLAVLGVTNDEGAGAVFNINAFKTMNLVTPWRAVDDTRVYAGIMVDVDTAGGGVMPALRGQGGGLSGAFSAPPQISGPSTAGLTTPASLPATVLAPSGAVTTTPYVGLN